MWEEIRPAFRPARRAPRSEGNGRLDGAIVGEGPVVPVYEMREDRREPNDRRGAKPRVRVGRSRRSYASPVAIRRFLKVRAAKEAAVSVGDPRLDGWETVSTFEDRRTAVAWRDQLRTLGLDACCVADHPLDRGGRGDIYLVVPPEQWSRANEVIDNLDV